MLSKCHSGQIYFFYSNFCLCTAKKATKLDAEDVSEDVYRWERGKSKFRV